MGHEDKLSYIIFSLVGATARALAFREYEKTHKTLVCQ